MFEALGVSGNQSHTFSTAGEHTIRFRNLNDVYINNPSFNLGGAKYTSIEQWGTSVWNADMSSAFWGASNLTMNGKRRYTRHECGDEYGTYVRRSHCL